MSELISNKQIASSRSGSITRKHIDDYSSFQEILDEIEIINQENHRLTQVNLFYESYLSKKTICKQVPLERLSTSEQHGDIRSSPSPSFINRSTPSGSRGSLPVIRSLIAASTGTTMERINITCLIHMVEREMEDRKILIDKIQKKRSSSQILLQAEEENLNADIEMIHSCKMSFGNFLKGNAVKKTGRMMVDKFSRYFEYEIQNQNKNLRKIKLKTKSLDTVLKRIKQQQKSELRMHPHPVDLDKLRIENKQLLSLLEGKDNILAILKIKLGKKGQQIVIIKSKTEDANCKLKRLEHNIKHKQSKLTHTDNKKAQNLNDLVAAQLTKKSFNHIYQNYKSPDVPSYIQLKIEVGELKKEKLDWQHNLNNMKQTINSLVQQLDRLSIHESSQSLRSTEPSSTKSTPTYKIVRRKTPYPHCNSTSPG